MISTSKHGALLVCLLACLLACWLVAGVAACTAQRTQTVVTYCSVCGEEVSRTERRVAVSKTTPFEPVVEDHSGSCDVTRQQEHVTLCPSCTRPISSEYRTVTLCRRDLAAFEEAVTRTADAACWVCKGLTVAMPVRVPVEYKERVAAVGPFSGAHIIRWLGNRTVLAMTSCETPVFTTSLTELAEQTNGTGWAARRLLDWPETAGGALYDVAGLSSTRILLASTDGFWLCDVPEGTGSPLKSRGLGSGLLFAVSPDKSKAILYPFGPDGEVPPLLLDVESGQLERLTGLPNVNFPYTSTGCRWSPRSTHYLYRSWLMSSDHEIMVRAVPDESAVPVSAAGETAWFGTWSPGGDSVAYHYFLDDPSPYCHPEADFSLPQVWQGIAVWSMSAGSIERLTVPELWITSGEVRWSPDGGALAFAAGPLASLPSKQVELTIPRDVYVSRRTPSGWTRPEAVTGESGDGKFASPVEWSPDGRSLLVSVSSDPWTPDEHRVIAFDPATRKPLDAAVRFEGTTEMTWLSSEALAGIWDFSQRSHELRAYSVLGEVIRTLEAQDPTGLCNYISFELSPDRTCLAWFVSTWSPERPGEDVKYLFKVTRLE